MQHRRVYLDDWCLMEKICLVSAVLRFGENWTSICDFIKPKLQENRPWDWFTADTCETQYRILLSECSKSQLSNEGPLAQIIQHLKAKCKAECQRKEEQRNKYLNVKRKLETILKEDVQIEVIEKYYGDVQREKKEKEETLRKHQEVLKKRDSLKTEYEKQNNVRTPTKQDTRADGNSSPVVTSPLLSSLLNNPPASAYRPTLSTSNFVPTKVSQGTSRNSSFEKTPTLSMDTAFQDNLFQELQEQPNASDRQITPTYSSTSSAIKRLDFQDSISLPSTSEHHRSSFDSDNSYVKSIPTSTDLTPKTDSQNLENLYLPELLAPEAISELMADIKDGNICIDKVMQDLENSEGIISDTVPVVSMPPVPQYSLENKIEQSIPGTHPEIPLKSTELINEPKYDYSELYKIKGENFLDENLPVDIETVNLEESFTVISSEPEYKMKDPQTAHFSGIIPAIEKKDQMLKEPHLIVNVDVEPPPAERFTETVIKPEPVPCKAGLSELEEEGKAKVTKPIVVIKRIDDGSLHFSGRNKRNKNKIPVDDVKEEPKEPSRFEEAGKDKLPIQEKEPETTPNTSRITEIMQIPTGIENIVIEDVKQQHSSSRLSEKVNVDIVIPESKQNVEDKTSEITEIKYTSDNTEDSDGEEKFEDALQTFTEDNANKLGNVGKEVISVETTQDTSRPVETNKELEIKNEETRDQYVSSKGEDMERQMTATAIEEERPEDDNANKVNRASSQEKEQDMSAIEEKTLDDSDLKFEESKKSEEGLKPIQMKIIKKYGRKRKNTSESNDSGSEMSIKIPPVVLREIDTHDSEVEQTFTAVHPIKVEPSDVRPEVEMTEKRESVPEKYTSTDASSPKVKQEKSDDKALERKVVTLVKRSSNRNQSPMKKIEEVKKTVDTAEQAKTRKKAIMWAHSALVAHKYSNAFQKPITNKTVAGYQNIVYKPMDLSTMKKKIENKEISTVVEFQRDVLLMINNAKMFNRTNSQVYNMAVELQQDVLPQIQLTVTTLKEGILRRVEETNENKIRKRQSLDSAKRDSKSLKRTKYSSRDNSLSRMSFKRPKIEDNDDSSKSS